MARIIEITHIYHVELPTNGGQAEINALAATAVAIMERHLHEMEGVNNLHSDWKLMPRYVQPELREMTVEEFEDKVGMFHDGPVHPWDEGKRIFPPDHALSGAEMKALEQEAESAKENRD